MTPFMVRVSDLLDPGGEVDRPKVRRSERLPTPLGADHHVQYRSLAEQLVCEANAVLASTGERLWLADDLKEGELSFCISFRDRSARVSTSIAGSAATCHLLGVGAGTRTDVELTGPEQVEQLILLVIGGDSPQEMSDVPAAGTISP